MEFEMTAAQALAFDVTVVIVFAIFMIIFLLGNK